MFQFLRRIFGRQWINRYHLFQAFIANVWFRWPSRSLIVIGVTGTDGKTTTAKMIVHMLETAGRPCGLLSTVFFRVGGKETVNGTKLTTVSSWQLQRMLRAMVKGGDRYVVIETSSHALDQYRVSGVAYDIAVITNTSHEHLDYHGTMEEYRKAKGKLFAMLPNTFRKEGVAKAMVLNYNDPTFDSYVHGDADIKIAYSLEPFHDGRASTALAVTNTKLEAWSSVFHVSVASTTPSVRGMEIQEEGSDIVLPLPGMWNIANACAAIGVGLCAGLSMQAMVNALEHFEKIPGRMEPIEEGQNFTVIIDYAVTPNAFEQLYTFVQSLRREADEGQSRIWAVFGATGNRDRDKRPILGEIAAKYADFVVLTNEDPWTEDPKAIVDAVMLGVVGGGKVAGETFWVMMDRKEAIRYACTNAKAGDIIVITGKGAETSMAVGNKKIPWDERAIIRSLVQDVVRSQQ